MIGKNIFDFSCLDYVIETIAERSLHLLSVPTEEEERTAPLGVRPQPQLNPKFPRALKARASYAYI